MSLFRLTAILSLTLCAVLDMACGSAQESTNAYTKARPGADEAATVMTLKTIAGAEQTYFARNGSYGTFEQLVDSGSLDARFAGTAPVLNGYVFKLSATGGSGTPSYAVNADPQAGANPATTGARHYFMDSTGAIHYNASQTAAASDPVLQ